MVQSVEQVSSAVYLVFQTCIKKPLSVLQQTKKQVVINHRAKGEVSEQD